MEPPGPQVPAVTGPGIAAFAFALAIAAILPACSPKPPEGPVEFTPPALSPGDTVRTTVLSSFKGGKFSASSPDADASGSFSMERQQIVEKTVTESGDDGPARCSFTVPKDTVKVSIFSTEGSQMDTIEGPLIGIPIEAVRDGDAWSLALVDQVADADEADALLEIQSFENRRWFPDRPVALGESWEYDPAYFRALVERDLGKATAKGRMTLRSLEIHSDGSPQARLDLVITSSGEEAAGNNLERRADIEARGTLILDLETMLDRNMVIEGTIRSGAATDTSEASLELPLRLEVIREILPRSR